uniref:Uncharacterized protein n=1 Tax=Electrophorus electricus TaxID=8005 RepID=A0AAY5E8J1_ELEEL
MDTASVAGAQSCTEHAKTLLTTLKSVLNKVSNDSEADRAADLTPVHTACEYGFYIPTQDKPTLFHGFKCADLDTEVIPNSSTVAACQPYEVRQKKPNKREFVTSLFSVQMVSHTVYNLFEPFCLLFVSEQSPGPVDSFEERMSLCKQLKGFHLRAVTMNRALGYVSAGDYKR